MVSYYPHCTFNLNPRASSIDTPLHSFVPAKHVDHMHAGAVQSVADLFSCPQLLHRQQWRRLDHPEFGSYEYEAPPFILPETPADLSRRSPLLGEHNDYVFGEITGLSRDEIQKLKEEGVIA